MDTRPGYVYILRCSDTTLYTGMTNNLKRRLSQHARGKGARYTRSRLPFKLVYVQRCRDRRAALRREWYIKHRMTKAEKEALVAEWLQKQERDSHVVKR